MKPRTRSSKKRLSPNQNGNRHLIIFMGIVFGSYLLSKIRIAELPEPKAAEALLPPEKLEPPPVAPARPPIEDTSKDLERQKRVAKFQAISNSGLKEAGVVVDAEGKTHFALKIKTRGVCHPGDYEAMMNVFGPNGRVLLSLEPMDPGANPKMKPVSASLSLDDIVRERRVDLPINLRATGVYGIYICGDRAQTRSCGQKKPADFNAILNHQNLAQYQNSVFYYQFSVIGLDYATIYSGTPRGVANASEQVERAKPDHPWEKSLAKARQLMQGVRSLPPFTRMEGKTMVVEIMVAKFEAAACGR
jgi:hypothetical protein